MRSEAAVCCRHLLNKPRLKNIQDIADDRDHKLLLLDEQLDEDGGWAREVMHRTRVCME